MTVAGFKIRLAVSIIGVLMVMGFGTSRALAQDDHAHGMTPAQHEQTPEQKRQAGALVQAVRDATRQFQDGPPQDYVLAFGCVSGGDFGAMGMHFLNGSLLGDGEVTVETPEILLYEPLPNGRLRLDRRRLSGRSGGVGLETGAQGSAGAHGTALSLVRQPESLRSESVLRAARVGLEGQSQRHVYELESQCFVRRVPRRAEVTPTTDVTREPPVGVTFSVASHWLQR